MGSKVWLWLGSDNNKGQPTEWDQGIRAAARCSSKTKLPGTQNFRLTLDTVVILPRTIKKSELLHASPILYAAKLSEAAIVGLNNYSSQVVQLLSEDEFATIAQIVAVILPDAKSTLHTAGALSAELPAWAVLNPPSSSEELLTSEISGDDPIFLETCRLLFEDGVGGVMFVGPPGTSKSWYARNIGIKLAEGDKRRIREVQFHPSYQYEDFVEGYVPVEAEGFRLVDKHLLKMAEIARVSKKRTVIIIDEFSRTDPARVLGEALTYMEGSLRGVEFSLPSGRVVSIPQELIFLATMNPDDRSVDEIDAAMERRWAKIRLEPDVEKLKSFLNYNKAPPGVVSATLRLFTDLQRHIPIGHAFFRTTKDASSLKRLWDTQLKYVVQKKLRFDLQTKQEIEEIWNTCRAAIDDLAGATESDAPVIKPSTEASPA